MLFNKLTHTILLLISAYLIIIIGSAKRVPREAEYTTSGITARIGQTVTINCGDDKSDTSRRFWRKGDEVLTAADVVITNNDRVTVTTNSKALRIMNVTPEDEGEYTCFVSSKPQYKNILYLTVQELVCDPPPAILHGGIENTLGGGNEATYQYGMKIKYYCDEGYLLIGNITRECADPNKGWTLDSPVCEDAAIFGMNKRLADLESEIHEVQQTLKDALSSSKYNSNEIKSVAAILHDLQNNTGHQLEELQLKNSMASLKEHDGKLFCEFTWLIENFDEKISHYQAGNKQRLESRPFYISILGYRMQLWVYPDDRDSGYIGFYAAFLKGEFDEMLTWPFNNKYELRLITTDENDVPSFTVNPSQSPNCTENFIRPGPATRGCGFSKFLSLEQLRAKKEVYLFNGAIVFQIRIYLNDLQTLEKLARKGVALSSLQISQ